MAEKYYRDWVIERVPDFDKACQAYVAPNIWLSDNRGRPGYIAHMPQHYGCNFEAFLKIWKSMPGCVDDGIQTTVLGGLTLHSLFRKIDLWEAAKEEAFQKALAAPLA